MFMANIHWKNLTSDVATKERHKELWLGAVNAEMDSLLKNQTPILVPRTNAANVLSNC